MAAAVAVVHISEALAAQLDVGGLAEQVAERVGEASGVVAGFALGHEIGVDASEEAVEQTDYAVEKDAEAVGDNGDTHA